MQSPSPLPPWETRMLCLLVIGGHEAVFLEDNKGDSMQPPSPLPPWEAQMLRRSPLGRPKCFACSYVLTTRLYSSRITMGNLCNHPRRSHLGRPKCFCLPVSGDHETVFLEGNYGESMQRPLLGSATCIDG